MVWSLCLSPACRGAGRSDCPSNRRSYSTSIMASDVLSVMDALGWGAFHLVGFSMGAMVCCKLAATTPERVLSLTLLSTSGGTCFEGIYCGCGGDGCILMVLQGFVILQVHTC